MIVGAKGRTFVYICMYKIDQESYSIKKEGKFATRFVFSIAGVAATQSYEEVIWPKCLLKRF